MSAPSVKASGRLTLTPVASPFHYRPQPTTNVEIVVPMIANTRIGKMLLKNRDFFCKDPTCLSTLYSLSPAPPLLRAVRSANGAKAKHTDAYARIPK